MVLGAGEVIVWYCLVNEVPVAMLKQRYGGTVSLSLSLSTNTHPRVEAEETPGPDKEHSTSEHAGTVDIVPLYYRLLQQLSLILLCRSSTKQTMSCF